ncbi:hypothetical protein CYMTET_4311 [Cymbomonas tetramitiformis]|uniref:Uncharacterized protein n=1 Tax=Cymbomonas tetramitiformis TaxID=36881 RepID=A0AAE0H1K7_9CHLO|nr:hypothetical protein CYMTET_4311 [Cymbomonas tetramitiformis]
MRRSGADAPLRAAVVTVPKPAGPRYRHFYTDLAIGAMSVAEEVEFESSDDELAAEVHARPRQQVGCGRPPLGIVPNHVAFQVLLALICFGMLGVGAALCIRGGAAGDTIETNNNFNV